MVGYVADGRTTLLNPILCVVDTSRFSVLHQPSLLMVWLQRLELRLNKGAQQMDGDWSQHTLALLEKCRGKYACPRLLLSVACWVAMTYFWISGSPYIWGQAWCHQWIADLGMILLLSWMCHDLCFINSECLLSPFIPFLSSNPVSPTPSFFIYVQSTYIPFILSGLNMS